MEKKLKLLLKQVCRSYEDFVNGIWREIEDNEEYQKQLMDYLENNSGVKSDEVLEYLDNEILKIEIVFENNC